MRPSLPTTRSTISSQGGAALRVVGRAFLGARLLLPPPSAGEAFLQNGNQIDHFRGWFLRLRFRFDFFAAGFHFFFDHLHQGIAILVLYFVGSHLTLMFPLEPWPYLSRLPGSEDFFGRLSWRRPIPRRSASTQGRGRVSALPGEILTGLIPPFQIARIHTGIEAQWALRGFKGLVLLLMIVLVLDLRAFD